jgi:hypothetical protein
MEPSTVTPGAKRQAAFPRTDRRHPERADQMPAAFRVCSGEAERPRPALSPRPLPRRPTSPLPRVSRWWPARAGALAPAGAVRVRLARRRPGQKETITGGRRGRSERNGLSRERERNRVHSVSHINDGIPPLGRNNLNGFLLLEEPESSPTSFAS